MSDSIPKQRSRLFHQMHVNINRKQQDENGDWGKAEWHRWLYEAKNAIEEFHRLPLWTAKERKGELPKTLRQCSRSAPQEVGENYLTCCLGVRLSECEILNEVFKDVKEREAQHGVSEISDEVIDEMKAHVCIIHILKEQFEKKRGHIDTSEGYILDVSTKMYWQNVYESMAASDEMPDDEDEIQENHQ